MELTPQQEEWLQALESGKYKQGQRRLKVKITGREEWEHCCLGVACEIYNEKFPGKLTLRQVSLVGGEVVEFNGIQAALPDNVLRYFGFQDTMGQPCDLPAEDTLANLNDKGKSFCDIAKQVRKRPASYFMPKEESSQSPSDASETSQSQSEHQN